MGLGMRRLNRAQDTVEEFGDDPEDTFLALCVRAPVTSLRCGISPYGLTMFNTRQSERLAIELAGLPDEERTPVVGRVIEEAHQAIRESGYLLFIGD
ncbi:hypothetical protein [Streptomyces sp. NPDC046887]|uniref:hypothetical protein n=1 Tax=Streptomyces sp. NPDC046887 TaxID=3155472 RepID=UPI0033E50300